MALTLLLFTGLRRCELCGLSWSDIDYNKRIIHVRRASQVQVGKGITEVPTKNASSTRDIDVPTYIIDMLRFYRSWWDGHRLTYKEVWQGEAERLFIQEDGKPINPDTINNCLDKVLTNMASLISPLTVSGIHSRHCKSRQASTYGPCSPEPGLIGGGDGDGGGHLLPSSSSQRLIKHW
jgi:integrase